MAFVNGAKEKHWELRKNPVMVLTGLRLLTRSCFATARSQFASDPLHFHRRKWILIERLLRDAGVTPAAVRWLDVGCGRGELLKIAGKNFLQITGCDRPRHVILGRFDQKTHQQTSLVKLPFEAEIRFLTAVWFCTMYMERKELLADEIGGSEFPGLVLPHQPIPEIRSLAQI